MATRPTAEQRNGQVPTKDILQARFQSIREIIQASVFAHHSIDVAGEKWLVVADNTGSIRKVEAFPADDYLTFIALYLLSQNLGNNEMSFSFDMEGKFIFPESYYLRAMLDKLGFAAAGDRATVVDASQKLFLDESRLFWCDIPDQGGEVSMFVCEHFFEWVTNPNAKDCDRELLQRLFRDQLEMSLQRFDPTHTFRTVRLQLYAPYNQEQAECILRQTLKTPFETMYFWRHNEHSAFSLMRIELK